MKQARRRIEPRRVRVARIVETVHRTEVRCPEHDHLLGVLNSAGQLVIKCDNEEYVVVQVPKAS